MSSEQQSASWTVWLRNRIRRSVPEGQWLPDRQPTYVRSWIYVFGVATLAAFLFVLVSGLALAVGGAAWWHTSSVGHFFNSMHLWSTELFFVFMVIHLWGKFFMAAWRGKRALTWITGAVAFVGSIATAFTGYLSQTNFDSQWISTQAKDGLNSVGVGAVFNVLNLGQMLLWHIVLLQLIVGVLVVLHVILVRRHGVVPPFDAQPPEPAALAHTEVPGKAIKAPTDGADTAQVPR
jgi:quinol-cytochrome oxidoreductase complex cytochrome b subunit